jgi:hypothetical protein
VQVIEFTVLPEFSKNHKQIQLNFSVKSTKAMQFLIDWDALMVEDPRFEKEGLLSKGLCMDELLDSIRYPQFVIENKDGEKRFFSDIRLFENETIQMKSVYRMQSDIDTVKVSPFGVSKVESKYIDVNRLKINESDSEIRIHYLFAPTEQQKLAGYGKLRLTSNWFSLKTP